MKFIGLLRFDDARLGFILDGVNDTVYLPMASYCKLERLCNIQDNPELINECGRILITGVKKKIQPVIDRIYALVHNR